MNKNNIFKKVYNGLFKYTPPQDYNFFLTTQNAKDIEDKPISPAKDLEPSNFAKSLEENLNFFKTKYNSLINSDVKIREFIITARNKEYNAAIIYIDGMVESKTINESVLRPLMLKNRANTYTGEDKEIVSEFNNNDVIIRKIKKFNLENYIYNHLIPQNDVKQIEKFEEAFSSINIGNCILLVDTLDIAYDLDVKGFKQRSVNSPQNEIVVRGSQEAFVENIRTNTSMLRRIANNENLVIENCSVGKITRNKNCCLLFKRYYK